MGHSVTLGGDRVGSGNKNKVYLHNYERSTHNLSEKFISSMGVGMLVPFMCKLATRDDKFEIDLNAGLRTIPTKGPLFGSFKLQLDVYQCPLRLYQALLHNNPLAIGLRANQIKFPKMRLYSAEDGDGSKKTARMAATNSLVKYLGISGIGNQDNNKIVHRDMFASGLLAYYDIFKNYYANKQEENAYTISSSRQSVKQYPFKIEYFTNSGSAVTTFSEDTENKLWELTKNSGDAGTYVITAHCEKGATDELVKKMYIELNYQDSLENDESFAGTIQEALDAGYVESYRIEGTTKEKVIIRFKGFSIISGIIYSFIDGKIDNYMPIYENEVALIPFKLSNIDDMRMEILSFHQLGQSFVLDGASLTPLKSPYFDAIGDTTDNCWQNPLGGICVKTYQSDIFNNWINTEWIDGPNGIAAITAISTSGGSITIDALNFSEKLYNLLNRVAVSGATYEDYLDAAYTDSAKKFCEAPMWIGGMSDEIVFEEIVQTAPAEGDPLGSLGGRGNLSGKRKGGKITCKVDEPSLIIGIVSITPRIVYTQGNDFFNTEIDSLQDIHVPALDGIAFQNLLEERLHAGATEVNEDGTIEERGIVGKVPAWIEYMTSYDRAFGDFADTEGKGYMVLQRDYLLENGVLQDATTYIDPAKYNYAFAYTAVDAQNFWVSIHSNIKARRLMSAKQIPSV